MSVQWCIHKLSATPRVACACQTENWSSCLVLETGILPLSSQLQVYCTVKTFSLLTDLYTHQNSCTLIHVSSCWSREGEFVCTIEDTVISFTTTVRNTASLWKGSSNAPATAATATQTKHRHTWQLDLDLSSHPASIFMNCKTFPKTSIWSLPPPIYFTTDRPCVTMSRGSERVCAIQTKHNTYDQKWGSFPSDCWLHKGPETSPFRYMKTLNQVNGHLENLQTLHDFI